ncbi:GFA family protein [Mangrovibacterium lignilyticum]|uniref:GFA family protein n=1 Tax=Mangrovibacterium lignilyticum TaxID=2668052 RepID=UPI0013D7D6B8|nr:GFA family protein [Mangrovibacterium lignilyticum]
MKHTGSCLCGAVTFEIEGDFQSLFLCHCSRCRKDTGSAHAANLFSTTASIQWLSGEDKVKTYRLPESRHAKAFCTECGSALPKTQGGSKLLVVPAGCLNSDVPIKPLAHIFLDSKANWDSELEKVPTFDQLPE